MALNVIFKNFLKNLIFHWSYTGVRFSKAFYCFIVELGTENTKKISCDKTIKKMWSQNVEKMLNLALNLQQQKKSFVKANFHQFLEFLRLFGLERCADLALIPKKVY